MNLYSQTKQYKRKSDNYTHACNDICVSAYIIQKNLTWKEWRWKPTQLLDKTMEWDSYACVANGYSKCGLFDKTRRIMDWTCNPNYYTVFTADRGFETYL